MKSSLTTFCMWLPGSLERRGLGSVAGPLQCLHALGDLTWFMVLNSMYVPMTQFYTPAHSLLLNCGFIHPATRLTSPLGYLPGILKCSRGQTKPLTSSTAPHPRHNRAFCTHSFPLSAVAFSFFQLLRPKPLTSEAVSGSCFSHTPTCSLSANPGDSTFEVHSGLNYIFPLRSLPLCSKPPLSLNGFLQ